MRDSLDVRQCHKKLQGPKRRAASVASRQVRGHARGPSKASRLAGLTPPQRQELARNCTAAQAVHGGAAGVLRAPLRDPVADGSTFSTHSGHCAPSGNSMRFRAKI